MRSAVGKVLALPEMEAFTSAQGATLLDIGPSDLLALTKADIDKWKPIIKDARLTVD